MTMKFYYDLMSQPARACYILFKYIQMPFEAKIIDVIQGQHLTDEYHKINYFKKVPYIDDHGFKLSDSIAIMKYAIAKHNPGSSLMPKDLLMRSKIEEFLHWYHLNLRAGCALYFRKMVFIPFLTGKPPDVEKGKVLYKSMKTSIKTLNNYFLAKPNSFIGGSPSLTMADILAACELSQIDYVCFNLSEFLTKTDSNCPNVLTWYDKVKKDTQPYFDESHKLISVAKEKLNTKL